jgi:uncharacterized protein (TIGR02246 family)
MKKIFIISLISLSLHGFSQVNSIQFTDPVKATDSVIIDFVKQIDDAWNSRDLERFTNLFTEDCDINYFSLGYAIKGKDEVRKHYAKSFSKYPPEVKHNTYPKEIIWLSDDLCMGTGYTLIESDPGDGTEPVLMMHHDGIMIFKITDEGPRVMVMRAWSKSG